MNAARDHLAAIASAPRPAGSAAEATAREYCALILREAGFDVKHRAFEYSTFPGRWGTPLAGTLVALLFLVAGYLGAHLHPRAALVLLIAGAMAIGASAWWLGRWGVLNLRVGRLRGNNLSATRGEPTLWLVAHLDSKSQPVPIGMRAVAIIAAMILWAAAVSLAAAQLMRAPLEPLWIPVTMLGVLAAIPVILTFVGTNSPGALDDASGVATVLRAVEMLPRELAIGVLLTSAEELGLAGARAWARVAPPTQAINVDGIDDRGEMRLIFSGRKPKSLVAMLGRGWPSPTRLLPGVLMDGVALADAGWEAVNISKGSWRTVSRIHTRHDSLAQLEGSGAEEVAAMLADAIIASRR